MVKNSIQKVGMMYGASILAIVLGFLISIFNSRVLGPDRFGDLKFIETVARFIASLVSVGFFISLARLLAINKEKTKERRYIGLLVIIFVIASLIGIVLILSFSLAEPYFFGHELDATLRAFFFIVPVILGTTALLEILKGMHKIYSLSLLSILPALSYLLIIYLIDQNQTIYLETVLLVLYGVNLLIVLFFFISLKPDFNIKKYLVQELFKENKFNGRPIYFGSLAGVATTHIAGLSISYFMNNTQVGFFMLALTICSPLLVIPSVMGTVFFKQFATIRSIPNKVFYFSILSTLAALVVFYGLIEKVVVTFYTEEYLPVADISRYLIIGFIFHGLGDLINRFLGAKGQGRLLRNAAYMVGIVNVLGYTILIKFFNINGAIITKILASGLYLVVMYIYYLNFVKSNRTKP
ncbi:MAG: lipopolysaccharide biosynthesis protein [Aurantibacter sp.]